MSRLFLACACVAIFWASGRAVQAQSDAVSLNNEPHHKRLLYTNDLRMWEVTLPPGQSTPPFRHEYDVATVVVGDGTLNIQRNGEPLPAPSPNVRGSVIVGEHTGAAATYRIENSGPTEYRAFEVENMREGNWPPAQPIAAPGSSVLKESRAFTVYDVVLKAGAPEITHNHTGATIVILIDGTLEQAGIGGTDPVRLSQLGQWLPLPRFQPHALTPIGSSDTHAIEIEVR